MASVSLPVQAGQWHSGHRLTARHKIPTTTLADEF